MTKATEQSQVGQALAIGSLDRGVKAFTTQKLAMERAFEHAWRDWSYAGHFRHVQATLNRNDITSIVLSSEGRHGQVRSAWRFAPGVGFVPYLMGSWTIGEALADLAESSGIPVDGWRELSGAFVDDFDEEDLFRE